MTGQRVLIVDDEDSVRFVLRTALEDDGWKADEICDADELEERIDAEHYDLVLLDLGMPGMNGLEALRRLRRGDIALSAGRRTPPTVKVLVISGALNIESLEFAQRIGADACLTKPFDIDVVLSTIAQIRRDE